MNKPMYDGLSILDISKGATYKILHDLVKQNYGNKAKLCYTNTNNFIVHGKSEGVYTWFGRDVKKRFDKPNYEVKLLLPMGKNINRFDWWKIYYVEKQWKSLYLWDRRCAVISQMMDVLRRK